MLMDVARSQLLVVDMQERLLPAVAGADRIVANAGILLTAAQEMAVPVTMSEQYPKGLGPTLPALAGDRAEVLAKTEFSCLANVTLAHRLAHLRRRQLIILGVEAHVCVLQTVLEAAAAGFTVFVVADATGAREEASRDAALSRMAAARAEVVTTEMVVFEWLRDAAAPAFRSLSRLIR
jgi:nicotinamidase-related amidase